MLVPCNSYCSSYLFFAGFAVCGSGTQWPYFPKSPWQPWTSSVSSFRELRAVCARSQHCQPSRSFKPELRMWLNRHKRGPLVPMVTSPHSKPICRPCLCSVVRRDKCSSSRSRSSNHSSCNRSSFSRNCRSSWPRYTIACQARPKSLDGWTRNLEKRAKPQRPLQSDRLQRQW